MLQLLKKTLSKNNNQRLIKFAALPGSQTEVDPSKRYLSASNAPEHHIPLRPILGVLHNNIEVPVLNDYPDMPIWVDNDGNERKFSTNTVWRDVREADSHKHLFFKCAYAQKIWKKVCELANTKIKEDKWEDIVNVMSNLKDRRNIWGTIRRLSLAATVYYIWQERN
ncbi:hypothetical protein Tco_0604499 [Tanacetum coccineum]